MGKQNGLNDSALAKLHKTIKACYKLLHHAYSQPEKGTGTGSSATAFLVLPEQALLSDALAVVSAVPSSASPPEGLAGFAESPLGPSGVAFEGRHRKGGGTSCASPAPLAGCALTPCRLKMYSAGLVGSGAIGILAWSCCNCPSSASEISFVHEMEPLKEWQSFDLC